jgi:site-specific recombinase XerD
MTRTLPRIISTNHDLVLIERAIRAALLPYRLMPTMLHETGMQASEVCSLLVRDVILEPGCELLWIRAENTSERVVLTTSTHGRTFCGLCTYLKHIGNPPPTPALFLSNRNTQVSYDALEYQWQQASEHAGLADRAGHGLLYPAPASPHAGLRAGERHGAARAAGGVAGACRQAQEE